MLYQIAASAARYLVKARGRQKRSPRIERPEEEDDQAPLPSPLEPLHSAKSRAFTLLILRPQLVAILSWPMLPCDRFCGYRAERAAGITCSLSTRGTGELTNEKAGRPRGPRADLQGPAQYTLCTQYSPPPPQPCDWGSGA